MVRSPNAEAETVETAGVEEALVPKLNPDPKEAVETVEAALPTPKPVNDDPPLAEEEALEDAAGTAEADNATVVGAEGAAGAPNVGPEDDRVKTPVAGVEAVVVVTVENSGADDVVNVKEPGCFEAGVPAAADADAAEAEAEVTLLNANEGCEADEVGVPKDKPGVLDDVVAVTLVAGADGFANPENRVVELEEEEAPVANGVENKEVVVAAAEEADGEAPVANALENKDVVVVAAEEADETPKDPNPVVAAEEDDPPNKDVVVAAAEDAPPNDVVVEGIPPKGVVEVEVPPNSVGVVEAEDVPPNRDVGADVDDPPPNSVVAVAEEVPPSCVVEAEGVPPNSDGAVDEENKGEPELAAPKREGAGLAGAGEAAEEAEKREGVEPKPKDGAEDAEEDEDPKLREEEEKEEEKEKGAGEGEEAAEAVGLAVVEEKREEDPNENGEAEEGFERENGEGDEDVVEEEEADPNEKPDIVARCLY